MIVALPLAAVAQAIDAVVADLPDVMINAVSTDTRTIQRGDLFVALTGEQFDGHQFVAKAADSGAAAAVVSEHCDVSIPRLQVDDTQTAYGDIARLNRRQFKGSLIALTGSAGKTSTKEMLAAILAEKGRVLATEGNFNNEIGVPKTLLSITAEHEYAVIEMGAAKAGDISYLTSFAEPNVSILTNAMAVHVEGFGDLQTVADTKGEIFECLGEQGIAVINLDDQFAPQWFRQAGQAKKVSFSQSNNQADIYASDIQLTEAGSTCFTLNSEQGQQSIELALLGEHNIGNALAAAAAAFSVGANLNQVKTGLEAVRPVPGRLQPIALKSALLINDSYNANPDSVKAAIDVLAHFSGNRVLVLGAMGELGAMAESGHVDVASYARQRGIDRLLAVGEFAEKQLSVFGKAGKAYPQAEDLLDDLQQFDIASTILVKGSRSARMERIVTALQHNNSLDGERT